MIYGSTQGGIAARGGGIFGVDQKTVMSDYLLSNTYFLDSAATQKELAEIAAAEGSAAEAIYEPLLAVDLDDELTPAPVFKP